MHVIDKPVLALTAGDLMNRAVVRLPETMSLRDAARLLLQHQIGGAPVVDRQGRCVGALTAVDFLRLADRREDPSRPAAPPLPYSCSFQERRRLPDGKEVTLCVLPPGVCPLQAKQEVAGQEWVVCSEPHCVLADWQVVDVERLPENEVRYFMTAGPITVTPAASIRQLARLMTGAHIHHVFVVDEAQRPVGVVSSTDLLAALARAGDD